MTSEKPIGEICEFKNYLRKPVTAADRKPGPYPYYGAATIQDWVSDYLFDGLHLLVGEDGTVQTKDGRPVLQLVDGKFWVNNHAHILRCADDSDTRFLSYALNQVSITPFVTGAAQPKVNMGNLKRVVVSWPNKKLRSSISDIGKSFDDRIALLRETNATLEAIAQALFKSWFVDFDPVHAKMQGRASEGMDEATATLFPDSFEDSELGPVPKGWATISFRDSINVIGGGTPKTSVAEYWGGHIPWFSVVDAPSTSDVFVVDTEKHITEAGLNGSSTKLLPAGTTIISARGTVGRLALTGCPMTMNQSCYGLRGKAGDQYFTFFSTTRLVEQLKQRAHGSVFDTITQETFAGVSLAYPIPDAIAAFEQLVDPLMLRIKANLMQIHSLTETRDTLLPRLISGQLSLAEAATETI